MSPRQRRVRPVRGRPTSAAFVPAPTIDARAEPPRAAPHAQRVWEASEGTAEERAYLGGVEQATTRVKEGREGEV